MAKPPQDVFAVARAFMKSRIILTAAELDLFTNIDAGFDTAQKLAAHLDLDGRAVSRVLNCLVTFDLLAKKAEVYSLCAEAETFSSRHPNSALPMLLHQCRLWETWSSLSDVVAQRPQAAKKAGPAPSLESRRAFIGAMHVIGKGLSEEILRRLDTSG